MNRLLSVALVVALVPLALANCRSDAPPVGGDLAGQSVIPTNSLVLRAGKPVPDMPGERHFRNVRQLTAGGENAEQRKMG